MHRRNRPERNLSVGINEIDTTAQCRTVKANDVEIKNIIPSGCNVVGEFLIVPQKYLVFGSDRKEPLYARATVTLSQTHEGVYVCPCTSKPRNKYNRKKFFSLPTNHVKGKKGKNSYVVSYVFCQYERIMSVVVTLSCKCVGKLDTEYRNRLSDWLKRHHSILYQPDK